MDGRRFDWIRKQLGLSKAELALINLEKSARPKICNERLDLVDAKAF
jgi:hypothetical protein